MISPSPTCTRRGTTPRMRSSAPTVTRRSSRAEGNLEGHNGSPATRARRCLLSVGGDYGDQQAQVPGCRQSPPSPSQRSKGTLRSRVCSSSSLSRLATVSTGSCSLSGHQRIGTQLKFRQEPKGESRKGSQVPSQDPAIVL